MPDSTKPYRLIVSGGGTGGHIYPAIAIANAFKARFPNVEILFVGAQGRMEMTKVPEAGYKIIGLDIMGLQRSLSLKNLSFPIKVLRSLQAAKKIIRNFKPDAVVGVGGYASAPMLYAAASAGIPTLIQEQNSYAGLTNKLLAKKADRICVAYDRMDKFFPASKIRLTGNPVRKDILQVKAKRAEALEYFKLDPAKKTLLVLGGSLGARTINISIQQGLQQLIGEGLQIIWQCGKAYGQTAVAEELKYLGKDLKVFDFVSRMDLAYAAADIVVSRAGALSIAELCLTGLPAILIPSPNVAEDHQTKNAVALASKDAALMVRDAEAAEKLATTIEKLLADEQLQQTLRSNIATLAMPDADEKIVDELISILK